jgi:hypothetical protein
VESFSSCLVSYLKITSKISTFISRLLNNIWIKMITKRRIGAATIKFMAVFSAIIGIILIGLYSWSINTYPLPVSECQDWNYYNPSTVLLSCELFNLLFYRTHFNSNIITNTGNRVVVDSLLISCGILIVLTNTIISSKASALSFTSY